MRFKRGRGERGAAMIETALILPVVIMLTFGSIEFGFAFSEQGAVRGSSRSAARTITTLPKANADVFYNAALTNLDASMSNVVSGEPDFVLIYEKLDGVDGPTVDGGCPATNCMQFDWNPVAGAFQDFAGGSGNEWDNTERYACAGGSGGSGGAGTDRVGVYVEVDHDWVTGLPFIPGMGTTVDIGATTVMALEPVAGAGCS